MWLRLALSLALFIWALGVLLPWSRCAIRRGLDLRGGLSVTLEIAPDALAKTNVERAQQLKRVEEIMRRRVDAFGVSEPLIRPRGDSQLEIQLAGFFNGADGGLIDVIKKPAKLEFRLLHPDAFRDGCIMPPSGYEWVDYVESGKQTRQSRPTHVLVRHGVELSGNAVKCASAVVNSYGAYEVSLQLTAEGARAFERITGENLGKPLGIVLDGQLYSAPVIRSVISDGHAAISGNFSAKEAMDLANALNNPLDFELHETEIYEVGPTLAGEMQSKSLRAAWIGCVLVVTIMVAVYALGGIVAVLSLALNLLLILGMLATIGATMTLPGIAALVLTVGMGVDSNILMFARMREELRGGKSLSDSLEGGFARAFTTILDANLTTLFTALILAFCGTGSVKGFGIVLAVGVVSTLFCALVFSRGAMEFLTQVLGMRRIFFPWPSVGYRINFIRWRRPAFLLSAVLIIAGISSIAIRGEKIYAIDFTGGEEWVISYAEKPALGDISAAATAAGIREVVHSFQKSIDGTQEQLKVQVPTGCGNALLTQLRKSLPQCHFQVQRQTSIGSSVSAALRWNALISLAFALLGILAYVAVRFELSFGLAAIGAIVHDILVTVGVYSLLGHQFNAPMVAAILMVVGYSINDTIIIFDRIREGLTNSTGKLYDIINAAIGGTLSRTLLTSLTTFVAAAALYLWGAGVVKDFALLFIIGILTGTFSSIFIASPIFYALKQKFQKDSSIT
jgi:SecD/SecF fusion protein